MGPAIHLGTCIYPANMLFVFVWVESWHLDDMHLKRLQTTAFLFSPRALCSGKVWGVFKLAVTRRMSAWLCVVIND